MEWTQNSTIHLIWNTSNKCRIDKKIDYSIEQTIQNCTQQIHLIWNTSNNCRIENKMDYSIEWTILNCTQQIRPTK